MQGGLPIEWFVEIMKALENYIGPAYQSILYIAGEKVGREIEISDLDDLLNLLRDRGFGEFIVSKREENLVEIIYRSKPAELYGKSDFPVDSFVRGLISGFLSKSTGKKWVGDERKCHDCEFGGYLLSFEVEGVDVHGEG